MENNTTPPIPWSELDIPEEWRYREFTLEESDSVELDRR